MEYPKRKRLRLIEYDYSQNGAYFVTICTQNREKLFGGVGADSISARMISNIFEKTISEYNDIECPIYVVMPNHFHAIIVIQKDYYQKGFEWADMESAPTLSDIVQTFKRRSTIEYIKLVKQGLAPPFDKKVWQRSYHDHIIRNEKEFRMIWEYIDENSLKWESDCFYV